MATRLQFEPAWFTSNADDAERIPAFQKSYSTNCGMNVESQSPNAQVFNMRDLIVFLASINAFLLNSYGGKSMVMT